MRTLRSRAAVLLALSLSLLHLALAQIASDPTCTPAAELQDQVRSV
jgi:hypothetical protein